MRYYAIKPQSAHLVLGFLVFITAVFYWPGLSGPLVLDDHRLISSSQVQPITIEKFINVVRSDRSGLFGRPVAYLSYIFNHRFADQDNKTPAFKATNIVLHLLCGVLIYGLLLLVLAGLDPSLSQSRQRFIALCVVGLWLFHPLFVSTVLYVSQRMVQLAALFTLAALLCYIIGRRNLIAGKKTGRVWCIISVGICFPLAVLSKEIGVLIPLYYLLIEGAVFRFHWPDNVHKRFSKLLVGLAIFLPLVAGMLYGVLNAERWFSGYAIRPFDLTERALTQIHVLWSYAYQILLPDVRLMGLFQDDFPISKTLDILTLVKMLSMIGVIIFAVIYRHKMPLVAFGLAWFFIGHVLESTVLPLEIYFEHRNYLPALGLLLPIVHILGKPLVHSSLLYYVRCALLGGLALMFSLQTVHRVDIWSDEATLYEVAAQNHPTSMRVQTSRFMTALKQSDREAMGTVLHSMQRDHPELAVVPVFAILGQCGEPPIANGFIKQAAAELQQKPNTDQLLFGLQQLMRFSHDERCANLSKTQVSTITEAATQNEALGTSLLFYLYFINARAQLYASNYDAAVLSWQRSFELAPNVLALDRLNGLLDMASVQIAIDRLDEAAITLEQITAYDQNTSFDYSNRIAPLVNELEHHRARRAQ